VEYDAGDKMIALYLRRILEPNATYNVIVNSSVSTTAGDSMLTDFTFSFTTGPMGCEHLEDYLEPNNSISSATPVELNRTYPALGLCSGDDGVDYYEFTVESATRVLAKARFVYSDTTAGVHSTVALRRGEGDDERYAWSTTTLDIWNTNLAGFSFFPGTYYVEIRKRSSDERVVAYDLHLETSDACPDDTYEDNDFIDEAAPISEGTFSQLRGCFADQDFFSISLLSGQTLSVTATQTTGFSTTCQITIFDPSGDSVASTHVGAHSEPIGESWTGTETGTHYFMVKWWSNDLVYDLDVDVSD
jgi:hypothetical protein